VFDPGINNGYPQPNEQIHAQIGGNASSIAVGKQITHHFYDQPAISTDSTLDFAAVKERYQHPNAGLDVAQSA